MKKLVLFLAIFIANFCISVCCFAADDSGDLYYWPCYDLEIIFARGSGGALYETAEFNTVVEAAQKITNDYQIITMTYDLDYPAISMDSPARLIGAYVSAGKAFSFGESVKTGVANLRSHYAVQAENCPDMDFALVGYSQGAMVVSQAADYFDAKRLKFIMLLGDPNTYLPEGEGLFPAACDGGALSSWRTYAPNCRTYEGVFGGRKPYELSALTGKYSLFCNRYDYVCGSSKNPLKNSGHTEYVSSGGIAWGMELLAKRFLKPYTPTSESPLRGAVKFEGDLLVDNSLVDDGAFGVKIDAPDDVYVWQDGEVLRLRWQAPEVAEYLLIRFNGFDLGYVDADKGEFEIRDVDFDSDYALDLAWMDSTGELGDFAAKKSDGISDVAPVTVIIKEDATVDSGVAVAPEISATPNVAKKTAIATQDLLPVPAPMESFEPVTVTQNHVGVVVSPNVKTSAVPGLKNIDKANIAGITFGVLGASGLLTIFLIKKRRGL